MPRTVTPRRSRAGAFIGPGLPAGRGSSYSVTLQRSSCVRSQFVLPGATYCASSCNGGYSATVLLRRLLRPLTLRGTTASSRFDLPFYGGPGGFSGSFVRTDLRNERLHQLGGFLHGRPYRFAQFHKHLVVVGVGFRPTPMTWDDLRLAADHEGSGRPGAQGASQLDDLDGVHAVGVERDRSIFFDLRLDEVDGAGLPTTRGGVDEDDQVVIFVQGVREVHPADAEVHDLDTLRQLAFGESSYHLDPEAVVAEEDVADAGDEDAPTHRQPQGRGALPHRARRKTCVPGCGHLLGLCQDRPPT